MHLGRHGVLSECFQYTELDALSGFCKLSERCMQTTDLPCPAELIVSSGKTLLVYFLWNTVQGFLSF